MTKVTQSEGCAIASAARIMAILHSFRDSSEANYWLESYKMSDIQLTAEPPAPYHKPVVMEVVYFVGYLRRFKVKVQVEIQQMLREEDLAGRPNPEKTERWSPLFGTVWICENDEWKAVSDFQFNWVTDRLFLTKEYRDYPYA